MQAHHSLTNIGSYNIGKGAYSLVTGNYNDSILTTRETAVTANTPLFIIGNGISSFFRSNACAVQYNGNTYIDPSAKNTGTLAGNSLLNAATSNFIVKVIGLGPQ